MQAEIDAWLGREEDGQRVNVKRDTTSLGGGRHWLQIVADDNGAQATLVIYGTPAEIDAFIDQIAALRSPEQAAAA